MKITEISQIYTVQINKRELAYSPSLSRDTFEKSANFNNCSVNFTGKRIKATKNRIKDFYGGKFHTFRKINSTNGDHILDTANGILQINVETEKDLIDTVKNKRTKIESALKKLEKLEDGDAMVKIIRMSLGICPAKEEKFYTQLAIRNYLKMPDSNYKRKKASAVFLFQHEMDMKPTITESTSKNILKRLCSDAVKKLISEEVVKLIAKSKVPIKEIIDKKSIIFTEENLKKYHETLKKKHPHISDEKIKKSLRIMQQVVENKMDNSETVALLKDEEFQQTIIEIITLIAESLSGTKGRRI